MGMGDIEAAIVLEELARADVSSAILAQLTFNGPPRAIEHLGSDALKERWLPLAARGEALFCIGISETEAGSAVGHMRARLTPDGDGFRLNAYKNYVTGGHKARVLPRVVPLPRERGHEGHRRGGRRPRAPTASRVAGTHVKMGLRGTSEAELAFDDVRIEPERRAARAATRLEQRVVQDADRRTSTTSAAATRRCASAPRRARSSTRSAT